MDIFNVLTLIGGLAFTLYGMQCMSGGLERLSGGTLERALSKATDNKLLAILLGMGVTALIQSSSSTTVMLVGFVNSGLMQLKNAVGVIMGSNIGTTITSWILSLTAISGDSLLLKMLKPTSFAPLLAIIGIAMMLFSKKEKQKAIGSTLVGFGILMFGMTTMSDAVAPLADAPNFASIFTMFENPILGVLVGTVFTGIIQSSAAAIGILQALALTGGITYGAAIPIILGTNIGTCVTALISCVGATKNAKRTAIVHVSFNAVGTVIFLALFYILNAFIGFDFINQPLDPANIAVVHTVFNVGATIVFYPFTNLLCRIAKLLVPDKKQVEETNPLDERFLNTPAIALEQCRRLANTMAQTARDSFYTALDNIGRFSSSDMDKVKELEAKLDRFEDELGTYMVKLSSKELSEQESHEISKLLHVIGDFERIGDHAENIMNSAEEMFKKKLAFSEKATAELGVMISALHDILDMTLEAFYTNDTALAKQVEPLEDVIDALQSEIRARHVRRLQEGRCTINLGFVLTDLLTNMERVSDHCSNIAVCIIQIAEASFDTHSYLNTVKETNQNEYDKHFKKYSQKFLLP